MNTIISIQELWEIYHLPSHLICVIDNHGFFKHANPSFAKLLGFQEEDLIGRSFNDFVHPVDLHLGFTLDFDAAFSNNIQYFTNRMLASNRTYKMFSWIVSAPRAGGQIYAQAQPIIGQTRSSNSYSV